MPQNEVPFESLFEIPLRNGVSYPSRMRGHGVRMVNMREIFAYERIGDQECERVPLTNRERESAILKSGDLLFARQSLTWEGAGKCVLVQEGKEERTWDSHLIRVRLDKDRVAPAYYYYYLRSSQGRSKIAKIVQQVAAAGIRGSDLRRLSVPCPSRDVQQAIAAVLAAFDDKIAANAVLAVVADALVRARYDALLATANEELRLGDLATNIRDQIRPESVASTTTYVGLEHLARRSIWLSDSGRATDVTSAKSRFSEGDVLFGKLRPYFHKVVLAPVDGISSTDILVVRAREGSLAGLVLAAAASDEAIAHCTASSEGTRMPRANWRDLEALKVPWPGASEAEAFSEGVLHIARMVAAKMAESATLAETRDALLPLLMSGKVRMKDAQKIAEEAL